ncbi:unnamed protein product, partial [Ectocarpus sp. 12 AP-2014]
LPYTSRERALSNQVCMRCFDHGPFMKIKQPSKVVPMTTRGGSEDASLRLRPSLGIHGRSAARRAVSTVTPGSLGNRLGPIMVDGRLSTLPAQKARGFTFHRPRATSASGPALAKDYYHVKGYSDTDDDTMAP